MARESRSVNENIIPLSGYHEASSSPQSNRTKSPTNSQFISHTYKYILPLLAPILLVLFHLPQFSPIPSFILSIPLPLDQSKPLLSLDTGVLPYRLSAMAFANVKSQFNFYNFYVCFLVSLGQLAFGYPASIIGVTLAQPPFLVYMGLLDPTTELMKDNANALIGTMNGLFQVHNVPCLSVKPLVWIGCLLTLYRLVP
jgi:hypothetical protein